MRSRGVHHVDLVVSGVARSLEFYRAVFGPLGWTRLGEVEGERGETIHYLSGLGSSIGIREAPGGPTGLPVDRYRVGLHHLSLEAETDAAVDAAAERIAAAGGTVTDGPGEFPQYRPGYYAVFFEDPDGLKLEIVSYEHVDPS